MKEKSCEISFFFSFFFLTSSPLYMKFTELKNWSSRPRLLVSNRLGGSVKNW